MDLTTRSHRTGLGRPAAPFVPMKPFDEQDVTEDAAPCVAVIFCTFCGNRSTHTTSNGRVTTQWPMTPHELRTMQRELPKMRCVYCDEPIDLRLVRCDCRPGLA